MARLFRSCEHFHERLFEPGGSLTKTSVPGTQMEPLMRTRLLHFWIFGTSGCVRWKSLKIPPHHSCIWRPPRATPLRVPPHCQSRSAGLSGAGHVSRRSLVYHCWGLNGGWAGLCLEAAADWLAEPLVSHKSLPWVRLTGVADCLNCWWLTGRLSDCELPVSHCSGLTDVAEWPNLPNSQIIYKSMVRNDC